MKPQHKPLLRNVSAFLDDGLFALRLPHVFNVTADVSIAVLVFLFFYLDYLIYLALIYPYFFALSLAETGTPHGLKTP